jgi:hypothetical protein
VRIRIVGNADGVTMALDQQGLQMLFGSHARVPSLDEDGVQILPGSPREMAKLGSSHLVVLTSGTRLKILDTNVYNDDRLLRPSPTSDRGLAMQGPVELARVKVVSGPLSGLTGWVRPYGLKGAIAMP